jgi:threonine/homoserine/homoserine lactone efflux protein
MASLSGVRFTLAPDEYPMLHPPMAAANHPAPSTTATRAWLLVAAFSLVLFMITAATYNALGVVLPDMVRDLRLTWIDAGFGLTLLGAALHRLSPAQ